MTFETVRDILLVLGGAIAAVSLLLSFAEFRRQGAQRRASHFLELRNKLKSDAGFQKIVNMLETDSPELSDVEFIEKRDFLGAFEEVALLMNSKLIRPGVAYYMFGYDSIRCWESQHFWGDVNRESRYWALFKSFSTTMKQFELSDPPDVAKLKF